LTISLVGYSLSILEQFFRFFGISLGGFGMIVSIAGTILSFWAYVALIFAVWEKFHGRGLGIKDAFVSIKDKISRFIGISIFCSLLWVFGTLLLVIPGIYWMVIFSLAGLVIVLEDASFFESFKRSKILVLGSFWSILFLYVIQFIISILPWFVYQIDMMMEIKSILVTTFIILYIPWVVVIDVDIYNRLKKDNSAPRKVEEETKKGNGWLGCLAIVGLFIAILVVGNVWSMNLDWFLKTDKGRNVYEWVAKTISPRVMTFGDTTLKRPSGYMVVLSAQSEDTTYVLYDFLNRPFSFVTIFVVPYEKLGIVDPAEVTLGSGEIWEKYYGYLTKQFPHNEMKFKGNFGELTLNINRTEATGTYQENGTLKGEFINNTFKGQWENIRNGGFG